MCQPLHYEYECQPIYYENGCQSLPNDFGYQPLFCTCTGCVKPKITQS